MAHSIKDEADVERALRVEQLRAQANGCDKTFRALYMRMYREERKEELNAARRAKDAENREANRARWTAYASANREELNAKQRERNAATKAQRAQVQRDIRLKAIELLGNKCAHCNGVFDEVMYDFHHADPNAKEFEISTRRRWDDKLVAELSKCVLLCVACHRKHHRTTETQQ